MRLSIRDLFLACIRRDYTIKHRCQSDCRLSVSRPAIPREMATWRDASQIIEQFLWVPWSKFGVIRSLFRKMVFEGHNVPSVIPSEVEESLDFAAKSSAS
jgi:hypothetical protein